MEHCPFRAISIGTALSSETPSYRATSDRPCSAFHGDLTALIGQHRRAYLIGACMGKLTKAVDLGPGVTTCTPPFPSISACNLTAFPFLIGDTYSFRRPPFLFIFSIHYGRLSVCCPIPPRSPRRSPHRDRQSCISVPIHSHNVYTHRKHGLP